jgi:hypothetical protein
MAEKEPFAVQAAKFSLWAPLVAIVVNIAARTTSDITQQGIGFVALGLYVMGLILGVVALFGMGRHGRKGILVRAVLGVCLNGAMLGLIASMIVAMGQMRARAAERLAEQQNVAPFTFAAPERFVDYPEGKQAFEDALYSYTESAPPVGKRALFVIVEDMGGTIKYEDLSGLAKGRENVDLFHEPWQGHRIPVFEIRENPNGMPFVTYNAQVPLLPHAVQIKVMGTADRKDDLLRVLRDVLKGTKGTSNW